MKHLLLLFLFCCSICLQAQEKVWTIPTKDVEYLNQLDDGKLILKDDSQISIIDHKTGMVDFNLKINTKKQPELLKDLPIFFVEGSPFAIVDYQSGYVIEKSKIKTEILGITYFWEEGRVIVEMKRDNNLHVLNIDLKNIHASWTTDVGKADKKAINTISRPSEFPPILSQNGNSVIFGQRTISILDPSGHLINQKVLKNKIQSRFENYKKGIIYALDSNKRLHIVDTKSDAYIFKQLINDNLDLKILGDGSTISYIQDKTIFIVDALTGEVQGKNTMLENIKMSYEDAKTDRLFVLTKRQLTEVDPKSASTIKKVSFAKDMKEIKWVFNKVVINGSTQSSPIDLNTMTFDYPKIPKIPPISDYVELDNGIGYIYKSKSRYEFNVVDENGNVLWNKRFNSMVRPTFDVIGQGVLIFDDSKVKFLSAKDGESLWQEKVRIDNAFNYGVDEETLDLYMYSGKRLYRFDHSSGTLSRSEDKIQFKDFDYSLQSPQLFVLDDAIFMKGSNTIQILNKDGTIRHKKTYKRTSNGSTVLDVVNLAVVAIAIGTGNIDQLGVVSTNGGVYVGALVDPLDLSASIADDMRYARRVRQNRSSNVYPYVFTYIEEGQRGFIFLNPSTGEERFKIPIESKNPNYIVDDYDGFLFHLKKNELIAYNLK